MSRLCLGISTAFAVFLCLLIVTACGNNGPIAPGSPGWEQNDQNPPIQPSQDTDQNTDVRPKDKDVIDTPITPAGEASAEAISDLQAAFYYLKESGGGALSIPMPAGTFAVHVWDAGTGQTLTGQAVVVCSGGPTTLVDLGGYNLFVNAFFPLTITVHVTGYEMATYVSTDANVLSFALNKPTPPQAAYVFGVAESFGASHMRLYSDDLLPEINYAFPSEVNPNYIQYELSVPVRELYGFSAFLFGGIQIGDLDSELIPPMQPAFWMANHFAWDLKPLNPGDHRFYGIQFKTKAGPEGVADGIARFPTSLWADKEFIMKYGRMIAVPTGVFLDGERYFAVGPHVVLDGSDPSEVEFSCPWFEPDETPDRYVMSGQVVTANGAADIVHRDWHPGSDSPDLVFAGVPSLGVSSPLGGGYSLPMFVLIDPLGANSDLVRIEANAVGYGSVWRITMDSGSEVIDTTDYSVPLTWISEAYASYSILYRAECVHALSQEVGNFTEDQIIMMRQEVCLSPWTVPMP